MKPVLPGESTSEKLGTIRQSLREIGYEVQDHLDDSKSAGGDAFEDLVEEKGERWDCETILSNLAPCLAHKLAFDVSWYGFPGTYSNLENHPRLIRAKEVKPVSRIVLDPKTGLPTTKTVEPARRIDNVHRPAPPIALEESLKVHSSYPLDPSE